MKEAILTFLAILGIFIMLAGAIYLDYQYKKAIVRDAIKESNR